jgi:hypothetical protein
MRRTLFLVLLGTSVVFAQPASNKVFFFNDVAPAPVGSTQTISSAPVQGAPYSATITNESIQTLADGNRIVQTSAGTTVRDSQGRTRQDAPLPLIGNMSPADAPHLVIIRDPVAQTSYTLNLTDKTAFKSPSMMTLTTMRAPGPPAPPPPPLAAEGVIASGGVAIRIKDAGVQVSGELPQTLALSRLMVSDESGKAQTEDLGSQTMEGVLVNGTRTTRTIPAGEVGNERPISIVTEVWTSPELKTIVYSKRSDPRMGDQTFKLTNIVRSEPDPSLFTIPADFKINDDAQPIVYKTSGGPAQ